MDFGSIIIGILSALTGCGGSILYFRPKLKEARASADKTQVEYLTQRIDSMAKLYEAQGKILDEVRGKVLILGKELQSKDERIMQLESENRTLTHKVAKLEEQQKIMRKGK